MLAASHTNNTTQDQAHSFYAGKAWLLMVLLCVGRPLPPCRKPRLYIPPSPNILRKLTSDAASSSSLYSTSPKPASFVWLSNCLTFFCFLTFYNGYRNVSSKKWKCLLERLTHYFGCIWSPSLVHSFLPVSLWIGLKSFIAMGSSLNSVFL